MEISFCLNGKRRTRPALPLIKTVSRVGGVAQRPVRLWLIAAPWLIGSVGIAAAASMAQQPDDREVR